MAWKSLDNNISVDINTIITPSTSYKSVVTFLNPADRVNLYPFKIVPLSWLISIGKYHNVGDHYYKDDPYHIGGSDDFRPYNYNGESNGQTLYCYSNLFTSSDPYIPLGDLIVPQLVGSVDYPVLLIANDPEYASAADPPQPHIPVFLQSSIPYMRNLGGNIPFGTFSGWLLNRSGGKVAIVKSGYLFNPPGISAVIGYKPSTPRYSSKWIGTIPVFNSSPYYTFGAQDIYFFDIIPNILRASCCENMVPNGISASQVCGTSIKGTSTCGNHMNNFCQGDNILTDQCFNYCATNNCNTNLSTYCQSETVDTSSPNYTRTCSCFNTPQYYQDWRNSVFSFLPEPQRQSLISVLPPVKPVCDYPECSPGQAILPFNSNISQCPPSQIQFCINNSNLDISGNVKNSQTSANSFINCIQQSGLIPSGDNTNDNNNNTNDNNNNTNDNTPVESNQDNSVIISVTVVICIFILILMYFMLKNIK